MATYPKVRVAQGNVTIAQINANSGAGTVIVPAQSGRTITVVDTWMRNVGSNMAGATAIILTDTKASPVTVTSTTIATLNGNVLARAGASGVTSTSVGTALTKHKGLRIGRTVADVTTSTSLDYCVLYTVSS